MQDRLAYLFHKYINNTITAEELEEFFSFIRNAENDMQQRLLLQQLYDNIKASDPSFTLVDASGNLVAEKENRNPSSLPAIKKLRYAAVFILLIGLAATIYFITNRQAISPQENSPDKIAQQNLRQVKTKNGENKYILLPDSSKVWLNAGSTLQVAENFNQQTREVFLSGEAFFDVKHDDKKIFRVHTADITTTVLGTAFNIKAYADAQNVIVAVSRGKVKVSRGKETAVLIKGQQIKLAYQSKTPVIQKQIDTLEIASWQVDNFMYEDVTLSEIINDLQRIYNVKIELLNKDMGNIHLTTSFKKSKGIDEVLLVISKLTDTKIIKEKNKYLIE